MDEHEAIVAELMGARERAAALLKAKLEAIAHEVQETSARTVAELGAVLPPDLEVLFPLADMPERTASLTRPMLAATPALECLRALDRGRAQSEVLQELLRQLEPWCGSRAIVVFREGNVVGWSGDGFLGDDPVRGWRGSLTESPAFRRVADGVPVQLSVGDDALLGGWLSDGDQNAILVPLSLRGKVVGGLVALDGDRPLIGETVQLLAFLTGLLLETLAVRPVIPSPSILDPIAITAVPSAGEAPEEVPFFEAAPAPVTVTEAATKPAPEPADEAKPEPAPPPATAPAPAPAPAPAAPMPAVPEMPTGQDAASTLQLKVAPTPPPAARTPELERKHEEARRFARLLVSEIRLYNEQAVQDGRAARDIYRRLREDIDRSREMYEQRVPAEVRGESNYFYDELVRILGDGDPDTLGV